MEDLPTVTLDMTLADLYKIGQNGERFPSVALLPAGWTAGMDLGPGMPRNKRYTVHEPFTTSKTDADCQKASVQMLRTIHSKIWALISQRDTFGAGNMPSIHFTFDAADSDPPQTESEALETLKILPPHQRPQCIFCEKWEDIPKALVQHRIEALALKIPIDLAEPLPQVMDMPTWYYLNSKVAIYDSGLPTPSTVAIRPQFCDTDPQDCCSSCANNRVIETPQSCTGSRLPWMRSQIAAITNSMKSRPLPFVVKLDNSAGGGGAWMLTTEKEREEFLQHFSTVIYPKVLSSWTSLNRELESAIVLLMDYIDQPIHNWGLTFFITRTGTPIFLSASEQKLLDGKLWAGSWIDYAQQDALKDKFTSIMHKITDFVHLRQKPGCRYYGPMGADILEIAPPPGGSGPSDDQYLIVDLNVRIPGSLTLGLLRSHFTSPSIHRPHNSGLMNFATNLTIEISMDRQTFVSHFRHELYETKAIVITSWYYERRSKQTHAALVVGGKTEEEMEALTARINEFAKVFRL